MLAEVESLQSQIQQAKHATEINHLTAENLKREVRLTEPFSEMILDSYKHS